MKYEFYRQYILFKANGANIHRINGLLSIVVNGIPNYLHYNRRGDRKKVDEIETMVNEALREIGEMTGVFIEIKDFVD